MKDELHSQIATRRRNGSRCIIFCFDVGRCRVVAAICVYEEECSIMFASKVVLMGAVVGVRVLLVGSTGGRCRSGTAKADERDRQFGRIRDGNISDRSTLVEVTSGRIEQVRVFLIRFPWDAGCLEQSGEILSAYGRVAGQKCRDRRDTTTRAVWIVIVEDSEIASSFLPDVVGFGRVNADKGAAGER